MNHEMTKRSETGNSSRDGAGLSRRAILSGAAAGFVLAASGLFLPEWLEEADAREGALGGELGGRHGKNRRGADTAKRRTRARRRDDRRDDEKREEKPPGAGFFRDTAITVTNHTPFDLQLALDATFYFRDKTGLDSYGPPIQHERRAISRVEVASRYAPDRFRVAVLVRPTGSDHAVYADVRNFELDFPRGFVTYGTYETELNPPRGLFGHTIVNEQPFLLNEDVNSLLPWQDIKKVTLARTPDSANHIEFSLTIQ